MAHWFEVDLHKAYVLNQTDRTRANRNSSCFLPANVTIRVKQVSYLTVPTRTVTRTINYFIVNQLI